MTDREALYRAICESPEDDTPRLVFADWLDEHGEPARAEFVRVQCEQERVEEFGPRWRALDARQRRLVLRSSESWSKEVAGRVLYTRFRRGFVEGVTVYARRFVAEAEELFRLAPVRSVRFADLTASRGAVPVPELLRCESLARLAELDLSSSPLVDDAVEQLAACDLLRGLRSLAFSSALFTGDAARALMRSQVLAGVTRFEFGSRDELTPDQNGTIAALASEPGFARVRRLTLAGAGFGPDGAAALAGSPHAAGLSVLFVSGGGPSARTRVGPAGAAALASSKHLSGLRVLSLRSQKVGVGGVKAIAASPHLAGLRHLDLSGNDLPASAVESLVQSPTLTGLVSLDLTGSVVPPGGWANLRGRFPDAVLLPG